MVIDNILDGNMHYMGSAFKYSNGQKQFAGDSIADMQYHDSQISTIEHYIDNYYNTEAPKLTSYLKEQGHDLVDIVAIGSADLISGALAAISFGEKEGVLMGNRDFEAKVNDFANYHGLTYLEAVQYVWDHELTHSAHIHSELEVDSKLFDFYTAMSKKSKGAKKEKYERLAKAAGIRVERHKKEEAMQKEKENCEEEQEEHEEAA